MWLLVMIILDVNGNTHSHPVVLDYDNMTYEECKTFGQGFSDALAERPDQFEGAMWDCHEMGDLEIITPTTY